MLCLQAEILESTQVMQRTEQLAINLARTNLSVPNGMRPAECLLFSISGTPGDEERSQVHPIHAAY